MDNYFWLAIGWSVAGFTIGFLSCWLWVRSVLAAAKSGVVKEEGTRVIAHKTAAGRTVIGILILVLLVLSSVRYYQQTSCQTQYNEAVATALSETSAARGKETVAEADKAQAQATYLRTLFQSPGDQALAARATEEYLRTLDQHIASLRELERVRAEHPMPAPADCT